MNCYGCDKETKTWQLIEAQSIVSNSEEEANSRTVFSENFCPSCIAEIDKTIKNLGREHRV